MHTKTHKLFTQYHKIVSLLTHDMPNIESVVLCIITFKYIKLPVLSFDKHLYIVVLITFLPTISKYDSDEVSFLLEHERNLNCYKLNLHTNETTPAYSNYAYLRKIIKSKASYNKT